VAEEPNQKENAPSAEASQAPAAAKPAEAKPATQGGGQTGQRQGAGGGRFGGPGQGPGQGGGGRFGGPGQRQGGGGGRFGGPGQRQGGGGQRGRWNDKPDDGFSEKVLCINRSAKVVKGGRRFGFSAVVIVGDKKGKVGIGQGKANQVPDCIRKASENARAELVKVVLRDTTIPHEVLSRYDGAKVLLRPASTGTGIIAGKTVRAICELAGVRNLLSKSLGSNNPLNLAKATLSGLLELRDRNEVMKARGKSIPEPEAPTTEEPAAAAESVAVGEPVVAVE
jgi:small subunit ribosomal protein S5|tara:strand:- start:124 stop:966 length:843 start_codon:yes stop_codon:yes gene_type:complete